MHFVSSWPPPFNAARCGGMGRDFLRTTEQHVFGTIGAGWRNLSVSYHWQICISWSTGGGKWIKYREPSGVTDVDHPSGSTIRSYWWRNESRSARYCRRKCDSPFSLSRTFLRLIYRQRRAGNKKMVKNISNAINFSFFLMEKIR